MQWSHSDNNRGHDLMPNIQIQHRASGHQGNILRALTGSSIWDGLSKGPVHLHTVTALANVTIPRPSHHHGSCHHQSQSSQLSEHLEVWGLGKLGSHWFLERGQGPDTLEMPNKDPILGLLLALSVPRFCYPQQAAREQKWGKGDHLLSVTG